MIIPLVTSMVHVMPNTGAVSSLIKQRQLSLHDHLRTTGQQQNHYHTSSALLSDKLNSSSVFAYDVSAGDSWGGFTLASNDINNNAIESSYRSNVSVLISLWSTAITSSSSSSSSGSPELLVPDSGDSFMTLTYIIVFSTLFFFVGSVGITGNVIVVYIVLSDGKMRRSMTNMLILNLALADSLIMLFGLPEIVMFLMNDGWQLGQAACSADRTVLVCALYCSVLTLVGVCIERYIAIVFPIKAHILCTKRRVFIVIILIWLFSGLCATPTTVFNRVLRLSETPPQDFCITQFHTNRSQHEVYNRIFKYTECALFYLGPLIIQVVCYTVIGKRLFVGVEKLHRNSSGFNSSLRTSRRGPRAVNEAIRARKGVVKMLMASVAIYFLSYSPHQILLFYNTFSSAGFDKTWVFHVFTTTLAYINSAANPVLYCIFSDNFRSKFKIIFHKFSCCKKCCCHGFDTAQRPITLHSYTEYTTLVRKNTQKQDAVPVVAL